MSLLNFTGFETGDQTNAQSQETAAIAGTSSIVTSPVKSGTYALRCNPATTATGHAAIAGIATTGARGNFNVATAFITFQFRYAVKPASDSEIMFLGRNTASVEKIYMRINSDGTLGIYDNTDTLVANGATVLSQDTWYKIDIKFGTGATSAYELRINDVSELSGTGSFGTTNSGQIIVGKPGNRFGNTVDFFYDDVIIDSERWHGTYAFPASVIASKPIANGSTMAWTAGTNASNYQEVDDVPADTTTYVMTTASAGDVALFDFQTMSTLGISGAQPIAVKAVVATREDSAVTSATKIRIKSGATDSDSAAFNGGTGYECRSRLLEQNPDGNLGWNEATVDATEVGCIEDNAVAVRLTSALKMILYIPDDANLADIGAAASARGGAVTTISATHVLSGNANRKVLILSVIHATSNLSIDAPTYDGAAVTGQIGSDVVAGATTVWARMRIDYVDEADLPASGSITATVTCASAGSALAIHVLELYNAAQGAPDASNSNTSTSSLSTLSVTLTTNVINTLIFTTGEIGDPRVPAQNSVEGQYCQSFFSGAGGPSWATLERAVSAGGNVQTINGTAGLRWGIFSASFAKASAAAATAANIPTLLLMGVG